MKEDTLNVSAVHKKSRKQPVDLINVVKNGTFMEGYHLIRKFIDEADIFS
jgi:hypothetical protein